MQINTACRAAVTKAGLEACQVFLNSGFNFVSESHQGRHQVCGELEPNQGEQLNIQALQAL